MRRLIPLLTAACGVGLVLPAVSPAPPVFGTPDARLGKRCASYGTRLAVSGFG